MTCQHLVGSSTNSLLQNKTNYILTQLPLPIIKEFEATSETDNLLYKRMLSISEDSLRKTLGTDGFISFCISFTMLVCLIPFNFNDLNK